jgi:transposase
VSREIGSGIPAKRTRSKETKLQRISGIVADLMQESSTFRVDDVLKRLKNIPGINVARSTVHRSIKRAGYTWKRASVRFAPKVPTSEQAATFLHNMKNTPEVISVDETCIYLCDSPLYGYAPKGQRLVLRTKKNRRSTKVTLLLAISDKRGVVQHSAFAGSCKSERYSQFISDLDAPHGAAVIMDNASFHHSACVREAAYCKGLRLLYTPPYSPEYNPVENAFSVIKSHTRYWPDSLSEALLRLSPSMCSSFFRNTMAHLALGSEPSGA